MAESGLGHEEDQVPLLPLNAKKSAERGEEWGKPYPASNPMTGGAG